MIPAAIRGPTLKYFLVIQTSSADRVKKAMRSLILICLFWSQTIFCCPSKPSPEVSEWSSWTKCSRTCGQGYQSRQRQCLKDRCKRQLEATRECLDIPKCPGSRLLAYSPFPYSRDTGMYDIKNGLKTCRLPLVPDFDVTSAGIIENKLIVCNDYQCSYLQNGHYHKISDLTPNRIDASALALKKGLWLTGGKTRPKTFEEPFKVLASTVMVDLEKVEPYIDLPKPLRDHCMIRINESMAMLTGGLGVNETQDNLLTRDYAKLTYFFNFDTEEWTPGPAMNQGRNGHSCSSFEMNGSTILVVASGSLPHMPHIELFNVSNVDEGWVLGPKMTTSWTGMTLTNGMDPNEVLFIGGTNYDTKYRYKDSVESLQCSSGSLLNCQLVTMPHRLPNAYRDMVTVWEPASEDFCMYSNRLFKQTFEGNPLLILEDVFNKINVFDVQNGTDCRNSTIFKDFEITGIEDIGILSDTLVVCHTNIVIGHRQKCCLRFHDQKFNQIGCFKTESLFRTQSVTIDNNALWITGGCSMDWYMPGRCKKTRDLSNETTIVTLDSIEESVALPSAMMNHCLININETTILLTGGYDGSVRKTTYFFNILTRKWTNGPDLITARESHTCASFMNRNRTIAIIMMGNDLNNVKTESVEMLALDEIEGGWFKGPKIYDFISANSKLIATPNNQGVICRSNNDIYYLDCQDNLKCVWTKWVDVLKTRPAYRDYEILWMPKGLDFQC